MPRFSLEYETSLKSVLTSLGMGVAFTEDADLTRMRAADIVPLGERLSAIFHVWSRCGITRPPWPGAFVSPRTGWGRELRRLKRRLTERGAA